jgi:hypothetical protein
LVTYLPSKTQLLGDELPKSINKFANIEPFKDFYLLVGTLMHIICKIVNLAASSKARLHHNLW